MMNKKIIRLAYGKYINSVLGNIAGNKIYFKITDCGFTTLEIKLERHSIIIEPNKPVIQDKCNELNSGKRKPSIRSVVEGVRVDDIVEYLQSDVEYKKIMTTPESFTKVVQAFEQLGILDEMYRFYFMLFDECEKTVQDIDYRKSIILPINHFFKFKNKAFVSATPIPPSDPRFKEQGFKDVVIKEIGAPKQDITVKTTNNVFLTFHKYLLESKDKQYFIFLNSTHSISALIEFLDIKSESLIFCSEDSKGKLKLNGYTNVKTLMVKKDKFMKFNFFTSRFNSAVDIKGIINPHIIIITDCFMAEHTKVDPSTEVVQIKGRFRRPPNGTISRKLTHITNLNPELIVSDETTIREDIQRLKVVYDALNTYRNSVTTFAARQVVDDMLDKSLFSSYVDRTSGAVNHFAIDNAVFQNNVNSCYISRESLLAAYKSNKLFNILKDSENLHFILNDSDKAKIDDCKRKLKPSLELLMPILRKLYNRGIEEEEVAVELQSIKKEHPKALEIFNKVGFDRAKELGFKYGLILNELKQIEEDSEAKNFEFIRFVYSKFNIGETYTAARLKKILQEGIDKFKLFKLKPSIELLRNYFEVSDYSCRRDATGKKHCGYRPLRKLFNA
ncbi:hypothetical protein [Pedobacter sp.]